MRSAHLRRLAPAVAFALALVGCGGANATPSPSPSPVALVVEVAEFAFTPAEIRVPAGKTTTIRLVNKGVVEHDMTIEALGVKIAVPIADTKEGVLEAPAAGTYAFFCSLPGHKENGMVGTLIVE